MRPDMILMSGGTDGGAVTHVVEMAEYICGGGATPSVRSHVQASVDLRGQQRRAAASEEDPRRKNRAGADRQHSSGAGTGKSRAGAQQDSRPVSRTCHAASAGLQETDRDGRCADHADAGGGRRDHGNDRQAGAYESDRGGYWRRDHRRVLCLRGTLQSHRQRQPRNVATVFPMCWPKQDSPISCAGCRSRSTNRRSAIGSRTRWSGRRRFRKHWTNCRSNMRLPARRSGSP